MSLTLVTKPQIEPLSVKEVSDHLRISDIVEEAILRRLITAARQRCERATRRTLITQTWDAYLDHWPIWNGYHGGRVNEPSATLLPAGGYVELPKAPLQNVSFIKYVDLAGVTQTWDASNYLVDAPAGDYCRRGRVSLGWIKVWPIARPTANAIQIRMVTGYGDDAENVPELLRQAMLLDIGTLYEMRSAVLAGNHAHVPSTARDIYVSFRSL